MLIVLNVDGFSANGYQNLDMVVVHLLVETLVEAIPVVLHLVDMEAAQLLLPIQDMVVAQLSMLNLPALHVLVIKELLVMQVLPVLMEMMVRMEKKVTMERLAKMQNFFLLKVKVKPPSHVLQDLLDLPDLWAQEDLLVQREVQVSLHVMVFPVKLVCKDKLDLKVVPVVKDQEVLLELPVVKFLFPDPKGSPVNPAPRASKAPKVNLAQLETVLTARPESLETVDSPVVKVVPVQSALLVMPEMQASKVVVITVLNLVLHQAIKPISNYNTQQHLLLPSTELLRGLGALLLVACPSPKLGSKISPFFFCNLLV